MNGPQHGAGRPLRKPPPVRAAVGPPRPRSIAMRLREAALGCVLIGLAATAVASLTLQLGDLAARTARVGPIGLSNTEYLESGRPDPDVYVAIAVAMERAGVSFPVTPAGEPTAFRPPTYPQLLVARGYSGGPLTVNLLAVVASGGALLWIAVRTGLGRWGWAAAGFYVGSPLILAYLWQPMTEVVAACWASMLFAAAIVPVRQTGPPWNALAGALLGLAILTRPVFAVFGLFWGVWAVARPLVTRRAASRPAVATSGAFAAGLAAVWGPWVVRNAFVFGAIVPFTTHGGYTLLLGNNPVFWDEVARVSPLTTWQGPSLDRWQRTLGDDMEAAGVAGEVALDEYQRRRAITNIVARPADFVRGVGVRVVRLWSPVPLVHAGPSAVWWAVGTYETAFLLLAAVGLGVTVRRRSPDLWVPAVLLIAAFQGVHLFYWANARMRAPLVPVLAVFAAVGCRSTWLVFKPLILKWLGRSSARQAG